MKRATQFGIWLPVALGLALGVGIVATYAGAQPGSDSKDARAGPVSQVKPPEIQAAELTRSMLSKAKSAQRANAAVATAQEAVVGHERTLEDLREPPPPSATFADTQARTARIEEVEGQIEQAKQAVSEKTLEATQLQKDFLRAKDVFNQFVTKHPEVKDVDLADAWIELKDNGPIQLDRKTAYDQAQALLNEAGDWDGKSVPMPGVRLLPGPGRPNDPLPTTKQLEEAELDAAWAQLEIAKSALDNQLQQLQQEDREIEALDEQLSREDSKLVAEDSSLTAEGKALAAEWATLKTADDKLVAEDRTLAARFDNLNARINWHNTHEPDPYDHPAVDRYNAEADRQNAELARLEGEDQNLSNRFDNHSRRVDDCQRREDNFNQRIDEFNVKLSILQQQFDDRNERLAQLTAAWTAHEALQAEYDRNFAEFKLRAEEFMNTWGLVPDNN